MTVRSLEQVEAPSRLAMFLKARLERRDEQGFWLALALALGAVAASAFLINAFRDTLSIQDDGRMFLSWMGRWDDPAPLAGDLIADYWESVTPWFYTALFRVAWTVGVEPLLFIKLLPAALYVLAAYFSFRFVRAIGGEPLVAFIATAFVMHALARVDVVLSGTPRAFWPVLLLLTMDGLARHRIWQTAVAQLLMTGTYPHMAMVDALVIGFTMLVPGHRPLFDFSARRLTIVGLSAAATVAGLLPFLADTSAFGPTITLAQARSFPTFVAGGRGQIFEADGSLDFFCGARLGLFNGRCSGPADPDFWLFVAMTLAGPLVLFVRSTRPANVPERLRSFLPLYLAAASLALFAVASTMLFRLHLPSRFSDSLPLLTWLATLPVAVEWARNRPFPPWLIERRAGRLVLVGGTLVALLGAAAGSADVRNTFRRPMQPDLIAAIARLPNDTVVAGFVRDLDFSPVLTNRSTLFSQELTIAYQLGYFRPVTERMATLLEAVLTSNGTVFADRLRANGIDRLLVEAETLNEARIPDKFRGFFGSGLADLEIAARQKGPTLLARLAHGCLLDTFGNVSMLDAPCLVRAAEQSGPAR